MRGRFPLATSVRAVQLEGVQRLRRGFTILELAVVIAVLGILGVVIVLTTRGTSASQQSDQERISEIANTLDQLSRAKAFFEATMPAYSFKQTLGIYPGRLSHLTTPITTSQRNSCGAVYTAAQVAQWRSYYNREIPTAGFLVGPGFITQDSLVRTPPNTATTPAGTLAIVIPNVTRTDAVVLGLTVDQDSTGTVGTVRYAPTDGSSPVTVSYITMVGGC